MNRGNKNTALTLSLIRLYQQIQIGHTDTTLTLNIIRLNQQIQIINKEVQIQLDYQQIQNRSMEVQMQWANTITTLTLDI